MHGKLHVHFDSILEPEQLYKLCLGQGLAVHGYGDLSEHFVCFNKDVDEEHLMMILHDRYELTVRQ